MTLTSSILVAFVTFTPVQESRPYVRVRDQELRVTQASPGVQRAAPSGSPMTCSVLAAGRHGEAVPGGGTLNPLAGFNPAPIDGANGGSPRAAFFAQVNGVARNQGIFAHDGTALVSLVRGCGGLGGSGAPGASCGDPTPIGGTFGGFFSGTPFAPAVNDAGDVLFLAEVVGGSSARGLFLRRAATSSIVKVAAVGDPSPVGGTFAMVGPGSLNAAREVVFLASGSTAGPSDVFLWRDGTVTKVAKAGDPAPGGGVYQFLGSEALGFADGTTIPSGPVPDINDQGEIVFRAVASNSLGRGFVRTGTGPGSTQTWIVTASEATPAGGTFLDFGAATLNESGEFAFFADYRTGPSSVNSGWFAGSSGNWHTGLTFFDPVGAGICFGLAFSRNPMTPLDDHGNLLLWTDVQLPGGAMQEHLVIRSRDGDLTVVARKGEATPIGGTFGSMDAWPSIDRFGRGAFGAFTPGAPGGALSAHFLFELCPVASASARNGQGLNRACFASGLPLLGATWTATVDASAHPSAARTYVLGYARPLSGRAFPYGELLVDIGSRHYFTSIAAPAGGIGSHALPIPNDPALAGLRAHLQAAILGGGVELCNALDIVLGF